MRNFLNNAKSMAINFGVPFIAACVVLFADSTVGMGNFNLLGGFGLTCGAASLGAGIGFVIGLSVVAFLLHAVIMATTCHFSGPVLGRDIEHPGFLLLTYGATAGGALAINLAWLFFPGVVHTWGVFMPLVYANAIVMTTWILAAFSFKPRHLPVMPEWRPYQRGRVRSR